jgi:hypothetical protein
MKHTLVAILILCVSAFRAQDLLSKNGEPILPEAKDWSIGLDASKFFKNFAFDFTSNAQTINGKYFIDAKTAYRFGLRLGFNSWTSKEFVTDRVAATSSVSAFPAQVAVKENSWRRSNGVVGLGFGIEKRRGKTRLQGFYGAEGSVFVSVSNDKFTYGNALNASALNTVGVDTVGDAMRSPVFGKAANVQKVAIQGVSGYSRMLERKNGLGFSLGARAFVGADYFVLPKMSIGGEFGWGFAFTLVGRSETTWESIGQSTIQGASAASVKPTTVDGSQSSSFKLDTDNYNSIGGASASLRINVYF